MTAPLPVAFDYKVQLTLLNSFLAASGTLLCDPVAKVSEVVRQTVNNRRDAKIALPNAASNKDIIRSITNRPLRSTKQRIFTAHPNFDETMTFVLSHDAPTVTESTITATESNLVIHIEDSTGSFLGQAICPFSLRRPSKGSARLMLCPRNCDHEEDPLFKDDMRTLDRFGIDDFGFINIRWDVEVVPIGGGVTPLLSNKPLTAPPMPVGVVTKANWIPGSLGAHSLLRGETLNGPRSLTYTTVVDFGDGKQFRFENGRTPVFVSISSVALLEKATFTCTVQKGLHGTTHSAKVDVVMPPFIPEVIERDFQYCMPVFLDGCEEKQCGILIVSLRLLVKPVEGNPPFCKEGPSCSKVNDPRHQILWSHGTADWGRPMPDCPLGAFLPLLWESEAHIARATERRWKRDCVRNSRPTKDHVRHMFEALLGRVPLDLNIAQLASAFFNKAGNSITGPELKQLLVAVAFHAESMNVREASRFAFVALRREAERAITVADVVFILEHSLLLRTTDMSLGEVERRVTDLFGSNLQAFVNFDEFNKYFTRHAPLWFEVGVNLEYGDADAKEETEPTGRDVPKLTAGPDASAAARESAGAGADSWKTFTVRALKTGRPFSVTAHVKDIVADVMTMIEECTTIPASRQRWIYSGLTIDSRKAIGEVFPKVLTTEVTIQEKEELLTLVVVQRDKNRKWEQKFAATDKVLKLRSFVQQKTMIPLSRCCMTSCGQVMQDRHALDHYKLIEGSIIEVTQQAM